MKKGFTLIECLVGLCIVSIIVVSLLPVMNKIKILNLESNNYLRDSHLAEELLENIASYTYMKKDIDFYEYQIEDIYHELISNKSWIGFLKGYRLYLELILEEESPSLYYIRVKIYEKGMDQAHVELRRTIKKK